MTKMTISKLIIIHLLAILWVSFAHGQGQKKSLIKGYDHNGKLHYKDGELPKKRCAMGFMYEEKVEKWQKKCTAEGGQLIIPDECSPRIWCSKNVASKKTKIKKK
jgi:hypothetical protein